jgi:hypothetical protein
VPNALLRTYTAKDLIQVCDTEEYKITEQVLQDPITGQPHWSTIYVELKGHSQTPSFANPHGDMRYDLTSGSVWFLLGKKGEVVDSPCKILVLKGTDHFMLNISENTAKYVIDVGGYLDMRSYFGIPVSNMDKLKQKKDFI